MNIKKRILYIGNKLSKHGYTPTNIETLGPQLSEFFEVISVSDKLNKALRLADMTSAILRNRSRVDLVLIDTYSTQAFRFAKMAGRFASQFGIPYVPILHGGDLPNMLKTASGSDLNFFRKAAALVAPSPYLFELFKQFNFSELQYIPNNIELETYTFKLRKTVAPRLLWVRSFHSIYNPAMAIEVLQQLLPKYPQASLCMVGPDKDGSMELIKKLASEKGLADHVTFTGMLEKKEWLDLSANYDIFINSTNVDNTPISVIEAMALGLPVVSTNAGGIPFLIEDGKSGLLSEVGNSPAMVEAIKKLCEEEELAAQLSTNGRAFVEKLGWDTVRTQWMDLVEKTAR
jgi:glycosyltransferase involved in cell wall biosynthesis